MTGSLVKYVILNLSSFVEIYGIKKDKTKKPLDQITANLWGFYFEQIPPNAPKLLSKK